MPNANWSNPTTGSLVANFVAEVKARDEDLAIQFDGSSATNLPNNTIRFSSATGRWQKYNSTTAVWADLLSTPAVDNNTASIATTAFVVGQAASVAPLAGGTAAVGTSLRYARQDHVHPASGSGVTWANFDGTGASPITPRANSNVSSVTKNGTGDYTLNFAASLTDANYCYIVYARASAGTVSLYMSRTLGASPTASAFRFVLVNGSNAVTDADMTNVAIFR